MSTTYKPKLCNAVLFAAILWAIDPIYGQTASLVVQRTAVAKVHVHQLSGSNGYAAAIYVGSSPQKAYFITANHVVRKGTVITAASVDLQFQTSPDAVPATILDNVWAGPDLAILSIPSNTLPPNLPQLTVIDARSDTLIHIIGQPAAGDWSVWAGTLQNENATSGDIYHFTTSADQSLAGGYSGGAVFDSPGFFLGMHTETTNTYGVALKATDILRQLTAWNVPHGNLVLQDKTRAEKISEVAPPNTFPVYVVSRHPFIDNRKLGDVTSGTITISIDDALNYSMKTRDRFEDQRADLTAGQHEVEFAVDLFARNDYNRTIHVKGKCLQSIQIIGSSTFEPHIKFDDRGNISSCGLTPAKH
jgi:hypothetical protein